MAIKIKSKSLHDICIKDHNKLSQPSVEVSLDEGKEIAACLDTLFNPAEGVGLAAPQLGNFKRVCIIRIQNDVYNYKLDLINPRIIEKSKETIRHKESCFSVRGRQPWIVERHHEIVVTDDLNGELRISGYPAYVAQHEIDHLDGILISDHGTPTAPQPIVRNTEKLGRNDPCSCGSGKKYKKCCLELTNGNHTVA